VLSALGVPLSRHSALRSLMRIPVPGAGTPRVIGIDDFALRKGLVYATIIIDAEDGRRVDVLPGTAGTCGTTSARPCARKSPPTPPAGRGVPRCRRESAPTQPGSAGTRSTACAPTTSG